MTQTIRICAGLFGALSLMACQFHARDAASYEKDTKKVLETKKEALKTCYDEVLKKDKKAEGVVAVKFTVEAESGLIKDAKIVEKKTTAPEPLQKCTLDALEGLKLDPPDKRDGVVSWSYDFKANEAKQL